MHALQIAGNAPTVYFDSVCDICTLPLLRAGVVNTLQATNPFPCNQPSGDEAFYYFLLLPGGFIGSERYGWAHTDRTRLTALGRTHT